MERKNANIVNGLMWKLLERFGVLGVQFVLQIILARLLSPEHYGVLSIMTIFTALANVFIQQGLNVALVQNKDVTEEDCSSVFWVTLAVAAVLYIILFTVAPWIEKFYEMTKLMAPFRVLALMLFPGALNSVQLAIVSRKLDFKKVFRSNLVAIITSGVAGVVLALLGAGLWALVAQSLLNTVVACVVMWFTVKWRPQLRLNVGRVKALFSYGWKLLASSLMDTLYQDIQSLVIGKKYDAGMLGYYDKGKQFPQFIISAINSSIQTVLLPAMAMDQDDKQKVKYMTRNSVMLSSYIIFPMMAGLAGVATSLVELLLTDKWLPSVPYIRICCLTFAFYPVYTGNLQAIKAMGHSDIFLKLEIIKKGVGLVLLTGAVVLFDTPLAIALTGAVCIPFDIIVNVYPNRKSLGYTYKEVLSDILPSALASFAMFMLVLALEKMNQGAFTTLLIQISAGVVFYVAISAIFGLRGYKKLLNIIKNRKERV